VSEFELDVAGESFGAAATLEQGRISIVFSGSGDMKAIDLLAQYLKRVHERAMTEGVTEVRCDFRQLAFMNSSCFKSFVVWIDTVKNAGAAYKIGFTTNPALHWQRRSLEALRRLAVDIVSIESPPS
jgi:hypothetical protein